MRVAHVMFIMSCAVRMVYKSPAILCQRHLLSAALSVQPASEEAAAPELPDLKSVQPVTCRSRDSGRGRHGAAAAAAGQQCEDEALKSGSSTVDGGAGEPTTLFRQIRLHNGSRQLAWLIAVDVLPAMPRVFSYHDDCGLTASGRLPRASWDGGGGGGRQEPQGLLLRAGNDYTVAVAASIASNDKETCDLALSIARCIPRLMHVSSIHCPLICA